MTDVPLPTTGPRSRTILCVSSFFKGNDFLAQCKEDGWTVILLTVEPLLGKPWRRDCCDEVFALASFADRKHVANSVAYLCRTRDIARITPLDDYDVELAAHLREHMRIPGMGETTARYFRDKLAMRERASARGIDVPEFVQVLNHDQIEQFMARVPPPWLIKPRSEASSLGIKKLHTRDEVWAEVHALGDRQSDYLIERMIPGDVLHVDSLIWDKRVVFAEVHRYRRPLFKLMQEGGGVFATRTVPRGAEVEQKLLAANEKVMRHLGLVRGVSHTEFILSSEDGRVHFLETAARVGGVHISDLVEATTGVNLWREWARIEMSQGELPYQPPVKKFHPRDAHGPGRYGGLIVSLAKTEHPDLSGFTDPEIVWRMTDNPFHAGLVVAADTHQRVEELLDQYEERFARELLAVLPPPKQATA